MPGLRPVGRDGLHDDRQRLLVGGEAGGVAALVADAGGGALPLQHLLEGVEDLGAVAQRLGEAGGAERHHHELLDVHVGVGVGAAVQDVHERHRQGPGVDAADVPVERQARGPRAAALAAASETPRMALAPSFDLVLVPSSAIIRASRAAWSEASMPTMAGPMAFDDVADGLADALAEVALLVAVAQLEGLVLAGGGAGRDGGAAQVAARHGHLDLDGGVAAGVEDLPRRRR